jgi:hypothetical protein
MVYVLRTSGHGTQFRVGDHSSGESTNSMARFDSGGVDGSGSLAGGL